MPRTGNPNWKKGVSGNPNGRPPGKATSSVTHWLNQFAGLSADELADRVAPWADQLRRLGTGDLPMAGIVAARLLLSQVQEPDGKLMSLLLDRIDGKLPTTVRTWRDDIIDLLAQGRVTPDVLIGELGADVAAELAARAGVPMLPAPQSDAPSAQDADAPPAQQVIDSPAQHNDDSMSPPPDAPPA